MTNHDHLFSAKVPEKDVLAAQGGDAARAVEELRKLRQKD